MRASEKLPQHFIIMGSGMNMIRRFDLFKNYMSDRLFITYQDLVILYSFSFMSSYIIF